MQLARWTTGVHHPNLSSTIPSTNLHQPATGKAPTHVMLLSDPQVKPPNAIRDDSWLGSLGGIVFDVSLKKNWRVARRFKPDVVVFLGDMLSGGKYVRSENE